MGEAAMADERIRLSSAIQLAATGDPVGLRRVYDMTCAKLFGICLRICGDREAAEDVLQDVYVKVWRRAGAFDPNRASPITWLATIARNAAIDWRRADHRFDFAPEGVALTIADESPLADAVVEGEDQSRRLRLCLEGLQPQQSLAIRRAFLDGLTYQELAECAGIPLGTVKSWIRRGMQKLKDCLGDG
ncbi:sigma-70 family RNA polymerase sigma factor [Novosphingobium sp. TCA1]|uniref:RNA polymerase sigma factor n=1 Tax=Novosphingobium pentaromativorans TaxID=205844 RepID=A0A2W5NEF5_9SPHN|nr:sigma-70 family RNA polymerase sigma factor [Novosphingobium sp. TCA1]PZQ51852.1 MAG: RNA polymerase subunit sigma [Novosphingobium pentaromativorans]GFE76915.1 RNA polymerase sigma factor [Novosphingobium sp. TCA1]